jgi:hypothetical protein
MTGTNKRSAVGYPVDRPPKRGRSLAQQVGRMLRTPRVAWKAPVGTLRHLWDSRTWFGRKRPWPGRKEISAMSKAELEQFLASVGIDAEVAATPAQSDHR